jgi:E3 ubiquitin-protein ligase ZNF598
VNDGPAGRVDNVTGLSQSSVHSSSGRAETGQGSRAGRAFEQFSFPPLSDPDVPDARVDSLPDETPFPSLSEQQSRYALALNQSARGAARLGDDSLFPPLPGSSNNKAGASTQQGLQSLAKSTLAARLQQKGKGSVKVLHTARLRPSENPELLPSVSSSTQLWPTPDQGLLLSGSSQHRIGSQPSRENGFLPAASSNSAWNPGGPNKMKHSVSTPNLVSGGSSSQQSSSATYGVKKIQESSQNSQTLPAAEDIRAANRSLVERMRAALGMDEDRYSAFKEIAGEYRQGIIDTLEYLSYVEQFGLSQLVPEMARLLPDPRKQRELLDAYYANMRFRSLKKNGVGGSSSKEVNRKKKGKGKASEATESDSAKDVKDALSDNFLDSVRRLQSNQKAQEVEAEVLSKDGYRPAKAIQLSSGCSSSAEGSLNSDMVWKTSGSKDNACKGGGISSSNNSKQPKKTSKFLRARLGDNSLATLDLSRPSASPERPERESQGPQLGLPVRGAWKNGGGQNLFSSNGRK